MFSVHAWWLVTRLGEAQLLLPAMALALVWLARTPATRPLAAAWLLAALVATFVTTASKVAFIGWEIGDAALDFTGFSGHSMFAALVLPVLARVAAASAPRPWPRVAVAFGYVLAAVIAVSRVTTHAHSVSEAVLGFLLGGAASAWALRHAQAPTLPAPRWWLAAVVAWLLVLPFEAPPSRTHDLVTAVSLKLSGRAVPYTRHDMHRRALLNRRAVSGTPDPRALAARGT
jgi:membrane-associated phospholipid phosphatase